MQNKAILIILDGWGIGDHSKRDAIYNGKTPHLDKLIAKFPNSKLYTSGENVGLPDGQMGNSEVGHLNIGAGRIVYQDLVKINNAIKDGSFFVNKTLVEAFSLAEINKSSIHFMGLLSDGGVHSSNEHLYALCKMAKSYNIENAFVHAFTDGRDTDPKSGLGYIEELQDFISTTPVKLASVVGRYYAMDRDKRWERVKEAYNLLTSGEGIKTNNVSRAVKEQYENNITDEFLKPISVVNNKNQPIGIIKENDVVVFFNFRNDRAREITMALTQQDFHEYKMKKLQLHYFTMTPYDATFKNLHIVFDKNNVSNTMGEYLSKQGKMQIRIAETEKYAHVTFFFSGGREAEFENEKRILIPSPKVATYDLKPEMSAFEVKDAIVKELKKAETDFICLNFANGDMVGHTGVYPSILKAVETVDHCVNEVVEAARNNGYDVLIIADHGNADNAVNEDGSPNTAHSLNPVPCILVTDKFKKINDGVLADVAPTLLKIMNLPVPNEMTGKILVN